MNGKTSEFLNLFHLVQLKNAAKISRNTPLFKNTFVFIPEKNHTSVLTKIVTNASHK